MSEKGNRQLTKRERKAKINETNQITRGNNNSSSFSRREFLKIITPGGWIPEAKRKGISDLSRAGMISLAKDAALTAVVIPTVGLEFNKPSSLKEKIVSFTWADVEEEGKLEAFVEELADGYLESTKTSRLTKEDLLGRDITSFYKTTADFIKAVQAADPEYKPTQTQWGYTHFDSKRVFIDLENLKRQAVEQKVKAGITLIDALWHEWGHLDVTDRTSGKLINNPNVYFFSPKSGQHEEFKRYRGAEVYTDTYFGFLRFEEVLNETLTVRRIIDTFNFETVISAADYYNNGVDIFFRFTSAFIPLKTLYQMHATSDFEGLAILVGNNLPGNKSDLDKGTALFASIHQANPSMIEETGIFSVTSPPRK